MSQIKTKATQVTTQTSLSQCLEAKSSQSIDLVEILERDIYPRLSAEQVYNWGGHDFKRSGNRLRGNPPWGQSKSGTSFTAFDDLGFLDAHNGNESGNPIKYRYSLRIGRYDYPKGKDWIDTVKELFDLAGVSFPEREWTAKQIKQAQLRESRQAIMQVVEDCCADSLWTARGEAERKHLIEERGFTEQGLREFGIGVYPSVKEVKEVLQAKGLDLKLAQEIGVLSRKWEGYMTFPWANPYGQPLTLYGHQNQVWAEATGKPKKYALFNPKDNGQDWLHSKESPYLLDRAIRDRHKELVLVEGITDAAIAHQFGDSRVIGCVAAMLSKDQAQTLARHRIERVIICLDPDQAGEQGIESCIKSLLAVGISPYVAPKLPDGLDPDEFVIREGKERWEAHIDAAQHGFRWKAQHLLESGDISTDKGKSAVLSKAIGFCKAVKNHHELDMFFWPIIRNSLGMEPNEFRAQLESLWESSPAEVASLGGSGGDGGDDGDGKQPLAELSLRDRILEILNRNQDRSHRDEAFIKLAQTTKTTTREIKDLAASLESEVDLEESRSDRKTEIENLLKVSKYHLALHDYLDQSVAHPLERVAGWMGTTSAAMLTTLYPVIGSLLKVGTRLELIKATDFYALPVLYTGLVCESGAGKTPAQKTILKPLFALQSEAEIEYKERLEEYQQELAEWKKVKDNEEPAPEQPVPREYYTTDATSEAIALIQSQQPNDGFIGWFDELPALFKSQGQYKNGRGADGEKILSGRDGTGFKVNRASGKRLVVDQSAYSITGSLQPLILRQMMGDFTDANGQWARFLWSVMQVQPAPYPDDAIPFDVSGLLKGIYRRLSNLTPQTYTLNEKAHRLYRNWYNELDQLKMAESRQGLRAVYAKMKGDTGVLALLLHCFNGCVRERSTPALEVDEATMAAAIKLSKYHIGQVKLIHSEGDAANGDVTAIHAKIIQLSERKGWLKAADVRDIDRQTKKQFSADDIRRHFQELEASGFGQTRGQRTKLMWSIYKDTPPDGNLPHSDQTQDSFEQLRTNSGQKTQNSGQTQDSLKKAESITNISVQQLVIQTQDTQDSFKASAAPSPNPLSAENETKATDPNFCDLSCPQFDDEVQNQELVDVSEDTQTQDSCPEIVLSCPEFKESDLNCPEIDGISEAIASSPAATSVETDASSLASEMPDFDLFPDSRQTASRAMKKHKAMEIKCRFEACQTADDFLALRDSYTKEELNWVRSNMISQTERARFTRTIEEAGLAARRS